MGKFLIYVGMVIFIFGVIVYLLETASFKIPGDIVIRKPTFTILIPLGTSIILSLILTIILNLFIRLKK